MKIKEALPSSTISLSRSGFIRSSRCISLLLAGGTRTHPVPCLCQPLIDSSFWWRNTVHYGSLQQNPVVEVGDSMFSVVEAETLRALAGDFQISFRQGRCL